MNYILDFYLIYVTISKLEAIYFILRHKLNIYFPYQ